MKRLRRAMWRLIDRLFNPQPYPPLTMGPDHGDDDEWMGERYVWEPGDWDEYGGEAGR
ncbi:hypothetical protein ACIRU3_32820 [Streptomyces sp. NPDC101151]|uniref:hypothetical protein n=1 Tax=Streptomyces sp. NPDC101151 TaxID=3366115 RepID=UPI003814DD7B